MVFSFLWFRNYFDSGVFSIDLGTIFWTILTVWYIPFHWFRNYFDSVVFSVFYFLFRWFRNYFDSVVFSIFFFVDLGTILTVWYFLCSFSLIYELFWRCVVFWQRGVFYFLFHWFILELFWLFHWIRNYFVFSIELRTLFLFWFRNYFDGVVFSIFFFVDLGTILTVWYFLFSFSLIYDLDGVVFTFSLI